MCDFNFNDYDETTHGHRFAAWAASREVKILGGAQKVGEIIKNARDCLEDNGWENLSEFDDNQFGAWFNQMREYIIEEFNDITPQKADTLIDKYAFERLSEPDRHRFACRAAFKAANVYGGIPGFDIPMAREIIEAAKLNEDVANAGNNLPNTYRNFNEWHRKKRQYVILYYQSHVEDNGDFTHGRAAKLINVYLKTWFSEMGERVRRVVHPPVDKTLLEYVRYKLILDGIEGCPMKDHPEVQCLLEGGTQPWKNLNSIKYQEIIDAFFYLTQGHDLWKIEKYWPGHQ